MNVPEVNIAIKLQTQSTQYIKVDVLFDWNREIAPN